jgi:hypothetical protein
MATDLSFISIRFINLSVAKVADVKLHHLITHQRVTTSKGLCVKSTANKTGTVRIT